MYLFSLTSHKFPLELWRNCFPKMIEKRTCVKQGVERSVFLLSLFNKKFCRKDSWLTTSNCPMISECVKSRLCFSSVQSLSHVRLFVTPCIAAHQASLSITSSRSSLKFTSIESVIPSSHLILCRPFSSCPQSLPASESFPLSHSSCEVAKVLEIQL